MRPTLALAVAPLLCAVAVSPAPASAAIYTLTVVGTVTAGTDRGLSSANAGESIFGIPGSLDGRAFVLTVTIDDSFGADTTEQLNGGLLTRRSSLAGDRPVRATLQISGTTEPIGTALPVTTRSEIARTYLPTVGLAGRSIAEIDIEETDSPSSSASREVFVQLWNDFGSTPPFADSADWRTPFTRDLVSSDICNQCRFEILTVNAAGQRIQATGRLAPTSWTFDAPAAQADVPLPLWAWLVAAASMLGIFRQRLHDQRTRAPSAL